MLLKMRMLNPFLLCFSDICLASKTVHSLSSKALFFPKHCKENERWRDKVTLTTSLADA